MTQITVSADYTIDGSATTIFMDGSAGDVDVTTPAQHIAGDRYEVKDKLGFAETNTLRVVGNGGQTVDLLSAYPLGTDKQAIEIVSDGSNWVVF